MAIPEEVINEIKYRNDIEDVISSYVALRRRGKNLVGLCPFHNEKTPSFTVWPENGSFYCFGCGAGGDVFTFVKLIENLDYIEAVKQLAEKSGVTLPEEGYDDSYTKLKNNIYEINRQAAKFYHEYLMSDKGAKAREYLVGRGLSLSTIKHFGLGAAPDEWTALINYLKRLGFSEQDMLQANVAARGRNDNVYDRFRNRVMFPIINIRGRVIGFSGRAMPDDSGGAKYVNTSDTPVYKKSENLFGMNFAKNNCDERIILVEGNMDVISLHQAGFNNAVAALGTAFTAQQAQILSRYTKQVVLMLDADAAGQKAVKRAGDILKDTGLDVRVVTIPDGKDPDEFIKKNGAARFSALLEGAVSEIEYKLLMAADGIDTSAEDGKLKYLSAAAAVIAESNDAMTRDLYISRLSQKYGVSKVALEDKVSQLRKSNIKRKKTAEIKQIINPKIDRNAPNPQRREFPAAAAAEETVIAILLQHGDLFETAFQLLKPNDMITELNRRIYTRCYEAEKSGRTVDISVFGDILSSQEMGYLVALINSEKGEKNALIVLKDSIKVILDEKRRIESGNVKDMSVDDWAENLKKIIEDKQKGN